MTISSLNHSRATHFHGFCVERYLLYISSLPPSKTPPPQIEMASPQAHSRPSSPEGYTDLIHEPHPGTDYQTRLVCFLLNHLQENLAPHNGSDPTFFAPAFRAYYSLYSQGISPLSPAARLVGLETLAGLHTIQLNIRIHKYIDKEKNHLIEAIAEGHAEPRNDELGEVVSCCGKKLRAVICIGWKVFDVQYGRDLDDMHWPDILVLLRKAGKKAYNQFGEMRSDAEASEVGRMLGRCFELDDDLKTETSVVEGPPSNVRRSKVSFRRHGESKWKFRFWTCQEASGL